MIRQRVYMQSGKADAQSGGEERARYGISECVYGTFWDAHDGLACLAPQAFGLVAAEGIAKCATLFCEDIACPGLAARQCALGSRCWRRVG